MRILVISGAVPVEKSNGEEWRELTAQAHAAQLYAVSPEDVFDYDVFVLDCDKIDVVDRTPSESKNLSHQIVERVMGGGCAIFFGGSQAIPWLPDPISPVPYAGQRVNIFPDNSEPLAAVLERFKKEISYRGQFDLPKTWGLLARALNNRPVSAFSQHHDGYFIVLPEFKSRSRILRDLLDHALPQILPGLARPLEVVVEDAPDWLSEFAIPRADEIGQRVSDLDAEIRKLRNEQTQKEQERRELLEYRGLLWLDGFALERVVAATLNLLDIAVHPQAPVDLVHQKADGTSLYIEVEGTDGLVQLRKGQQLLSYIAQSDDPAATSGAIIGNPYRKQNPADRPPGMEQLFSPPLRRLAEKQNWRLSTTVELFRLAQSHLSGQLRASQEAQAMLGL